MTIPDHFRTAAVKEGWQAPVHDAALRWAPSVTPSPTHEYGFLLTAFRAPCATRLILRSLRRWYATAPFYVFTDNMAGGGRNFSRLCAAHAPCEWRGFAGSAGNPDAARSGQGLDGAMQYIWRLLAPMASCDCSFLITLEDDVCVQACAVARPPPIASARGHQRPHAEALTSRTPRR